MSSEKGLKGFRQERKPTKLESKNEKMAREAKYATEQLEKLYNQLYGLSSSLNDVVMGTVNLLMKKNIFTQQELDDSMKEYAEIKRREGLDHKVRSMGYGDVEEISTKDSLVLARVDVSIEGKKLPSYPKDLFFKLDRTYLFPGLEEELVGLKLEDEKEFSLVMNEECRVEEIRGKELNFDIKILDIRKKLER